ncbi:MAG TPA: DUF6675 family protein [Rhizomicrobium sp.]
MKIFATLLLCLAILPSAVRAGALPAPCGLPSPGFGRPGEAPQVKVLLAEDLASTKWTPPACTGWSAAPAALVVGVSGSFRFAGTQDELLKRIAAISSLPSVRYWSRTADAWRPVATEASALSAPDVKKRRPDFSPSEFMQGANLYYWEDDSRVGGMIYRLSVRERSADRIVVASENVSPAKYLFVTISRPGALQSVMTLQRFSPGLWGAYFLSRMGERPSALLPLPERSFVNRAVAAYRQLAGIPTDQEPPAEP